jgi:hypothetical protein
VATSVIDFSASLASNAMSGELTSQRTSWIYSEVLGMTSAAVQGRKRLCGVALRVASRV